MNIIYMTSKLSVQQQRAERVAQPTHRPVVPDRRSAEAHFAGPPPAKTWQSSSGIFSAALCIAGTIGQPPGVME